MHAFVWFLAVLFVLLGVILWVWKKILSIDFDKGLHPLTQPSGVSLGESRSRASSMTPSGDDGFGESMVIGMVTGVPIGTNMAGALVGAALHESMSSTHHDHSHHRDTGSMSSASDSQTSSGSADVGSGGGHDSGSSSGSYDSGSSSSYSSSD